MTLEWIIERLKINGKNAKQEVLRALENASYEELCELERSVNNEIVNGILKKNIRKEKKVYEN